jgi:hypothetical protein
VGARDPQAGQATAEYAAVVLLVALLLATAGGVAAARGGAVGDAVTRQIARALCIVTGGDCDHELEPCVVGSTSRTVTNGLTVAVARWGGDRIVLEERRSDGSVLVTYAEHEGLGLDVDGGTGAGLSLGGRTVRIGGELATAVLARGGTGATWELPDPRAAAALVEQLRRGRWAQAAASAQTRFGEHDLTVSGEAAVSLRGVGGSLGLSVAGTWGSRVEPATGRRTFYVRRANELVATGTVAGAGASGRGSREEEYAVTVEAGPSTWRCCGPAGSRAPPTYRPPSSRSPACWRSRRRPAASG